MIHDFNKLAGTEEYVSPSLDTVSVRTERGFCDSIVDATHDPYTDGDNVDFNWGN